jgi:hypothetical protein
MSTERACVCGHSESAHNCTWLAWCAHGDAEARCMCRQFRPVLPWPDGEGWWGLHRPFIESRWQPVYAVVCEGEITVAMLGWPGLIRRSENFPLLRGLADTATEFTRLLEENPFTEQPAMGESKIKCHQCGDLFPRNKMVICHDETWAYCPECWEPIVKQYAVDYPECCDTCVPRRPPVRVDWDSVFPRHGGRIPPAHE